MRVRHALLGVMLTALAPRMALACPVCFGQNDSPLASAINAGVIVMLGFVVAVLGAFGAFIVHLNRRARLVAQADEERSLEPAEGTAQC